MQAPVATGAWQPQVDGAVRTLTSFARDADRLDASSDRRTPRIPMLLYPRLGGYCQPGAKLRAPSGMPDRRHPHRNGGADRADGSQGSGLIGADRSTSSFRSALAGRPRP